jgi:ABC-type maltose transport system permease subunit
MKQKDIALIIIVIFISGIISYFLSSTFITTPKSRKTEVEVVEPISSQFTKPDERYFNANSINPTQQIQIGNQDNQQPF